MHCCNRSLQCGLSHVASVTRWERDVPTAAETAVGDCPLDSPEFRARPALRLDSTPLWWMRGKKNSASGFLLSLLSRLLELLEQLTRELDLEYHNVIATARAGVCCFNRSASATTELWPERCWLPSSATTRPSCRPCGASMIAGWRYLRTTSSPRQNRSGSVLLRYLAVPAPLREGRFAACQSFPRATRISRRSQMGIHSRAGSISAGRWRAERVLLDLPIPRQLPACSDS